MPRLTGALGNGQQNSKIIIRKRKHSQDFSTVFCKAAVKRMWLPRRIGQGLWTVWTTFERRQLTLSMSTERSRARVSSQAEFFDASETTIRDDHSPLEEENRLPRVHGRAVAHTHCTPHHVRRRDPLRQRRCRQISFGPSGVVLGQPGCARRYRRLPALAVQGA